MHCKIMRSFSSFFYFVDICVGKKSLFCISEEAKVKSLHKFDTGKEFSHTRAFVEI